jgi:hypothetical protein
VPDDRIRVPRIRSACSHLPRGGIQVQSASRTSLRNQLADRVLFISACAWRRATFAIFIVHYFPQAGRDRDHDLQDRPPKRVHPFPINLKM